MSVPRGPAALARLRSLLDTAQPNQPYLETEPLPAGLTSAPPNRWLWRRLPHLTTPYLTTPWPRSVARTPRTTDLSRRVRRYATRRPTRSATPPDQSCCTSRPTSRCPGPGR